MKEEEYLDSLNKLSSYTYLANLLFTLVNTKVNSVDSTMAFREITSGGLSYIKKDSVIESVFGSALFREEESLEAINGMESFLNDYIHLNINKYFNISVIEYMYLTRPERVRLNKVAREKDEYERKVLENINKNHQVKNNVMYDDLGLKS